MHNRRRACAYGTVAFLFLTLIAICVHRIGYRRGYVDAKCETLPFDLGIYLQLYDMRTILPTNVAIRVFSEPSIRLLIYGTLVALEKNSERVRKTQSNRDGFRFDQERFDRKVERAKQIVEGTEDEMVFLGDVIRQGVEGSPANSDHDETAAP
jgi:hypothetical protein